MRSVALMALTVVFAGVALAGPLPYDEKDYDPYKTYKKGKSSVLENYFENELDKEKKEAFKEPAIQKAKAVDYLNVKEPKKHEVAERLMFGELDLRLVKPKTRGPRNQPGFCPSFPNYRSDVLIQRREGVNQAQWPHLRQGQVRNLGRFKALVSDKPTDSDKPLYRVLEAKVSVEEGGFFQEGEVEKPLCEEAKAELAKITYAKVKRECPGGGRDTFAAMNHVWTELEQEIHYVHFNHEVIPTKKTLTCKAYAQICCFSQEIGWPIHSLFKNEGGTDNDENVNNDFSFVGERGLTKLQGSTENLSAPTGVGKDTWMNRRVPFVVSVQKKLPKTVTINVLDKERQKLLEDLQEELINPKQFEKNFEKLDLFRRLSEERYHSSLESMKLHPKATFKMIEMYKLGESTKILDLTNEAIKNLQRRFYPNRDLTDK